MKRNRPNYGLIAVIYFCVLITASIWTLAIHFHVVPILISLYAIYFLWMAKAMHESNENIK